MKMKGLEMGLEGWRSRPSDRNCIIGAGGAVPLPHSHHTTLNTAHQDSRTTDGHASSLSQPCTSPHCLCVLQSIVSNICSCLLVQLIHIIPNIHCGRDWLSDNGSMAQNPPSESVGPEYKPEKEKPTATVSTQMPHTNVTVLPQTPQLIALLTYVRYTTRPYPVRSRS